MGVRDGDNLGEALSAAKARFPDGHVVVVGDSRRRELVATAIASEATSFIDENVATMIRQRVRAGLSVIKAKIERDGKFVSTAGKVRRLGRPGAGPTS